MNQIPDFEISTNSQIHRFSLVEIYDKNLFVDIVILISCIVSQAITVFMCTHCQNSVGHFAACSIQNVGVTIVF